MAARSVSELLPAAFEDLARAHVGAIVESVGEERESLFFERKRSVTPATLAKSCAAFANTYGGLLIVGIEDETDVLVGVQRIAEPQVWVKDVLRPHVLPMPAFRARWLPLNESSDLGVLLVLVEESTTTPHLITRSGVIYVRNPGSSDPVPVNDQARLLDLTRRGREARHEAESRVKRHLGAKPVAAAARQALALAPTGLVDNPLRSLYGSDYDLSGFDQLVRWTEPGPYVRRERQWHQTFASLTRYVQGTSSFEPGSVRAATLFEEGVLVVETGDLERGREDSLQLVDLVDWLLEVLHAARQVLITLGAHGDLRLSYEAQLTGRHVFYAPSRAEKARGPVAFQEWVQLNPDQAQDKAFRELAEAEIRRGLGIRHREA